MSMQIKLIAFALVGFICSGIVHADYDVANLQKLFTDKQQRAKIDAARTGNYSVAGVQKTHQVKVSGYVTRSDGKNVVWLNGKSTLEGSKIDGVKVYHSSVGKNKKVTVNVDGKTVRIKPGDAWVRESGDDADGATQ